MSHSVACAKVAVPQDCSGGAGSASTGWSTAPVYRSAIITEIKCSSGLSACQHQYQPVNGCLSLIKLNVVDANAGYALTPNKRSSWLSDPVGRLSWSLCRDDIRLMPVQELSHAHGRGAVRFTVILRGRDCGRCARSTTTRTVTAHATDFQPQLSVHTEGRNAGGYQWAGLFWVSARL